MSTSGIISPFQGHMTILPSGCFQSGVLLYKEYNGGRRNHKGKCGKWGVRLSQGSPPSPVSLQSWVLAEEKGNRGEPVGEKELTWDVKGPLTCLAPARQQEQRGTPLYESCGKRPAVIPSILEAVPPKPTLQPSIPEASRQLACLPIRESPGRTGEIPCASDFAKICSISTRLG